ncbi:unnamed protein product [Adineta ricciae]|uniref:DED domain-containing protein n=1 Tax=Adineta ricciae TaxID=249248 RepID=A0A814G1U5_ADIRI|nr:unnamed protein product [Adineta ricciae]CAF1077133.1 unnamed protein product [Adineta ricciae]
MTGHFEFRELLLKIHDLLSDNDRERLHFLLGDDVPRNLRDDLSLGGTLRVLQALFDKAIINDQDCIYLIEALEKIRCFDASKRLKEYQRNQRQLDTQSLSLTDILWRDNDEDKVAISRTTDDLHDEDLRRIPTSSFTEKSIATNQRPPLNPIIINEPIEEETVKSSRIRRLFCTSISYREWVLITTLLLVIITIPLSMTFWKRSDEKIRTKINRAQLIDDITSNARWSQNGITVLGGNGPGDGLNQLRNPGTIDIDDENTIYVVDDNNNRVLEKKLNQTTPRIVAGGNGIGGENNQLNHPVHVIVEKSRESLIICDSGNRRLMRWSISTGTSEEMILTDIVCQGLALDKHGFLYVSNKKAGEIRRFRVGERNGTVVITGASTVRQLYAPSFFAIDHDDSIYVSDTTGNRITKWTIGAQEGVVIAGSLDSGTDSTHFSRPFGIVLDHMKTIYVVDSDNSRVIRWREGMTKGDVIIGGRGRGDRADQLDNPIDIAFDQQGNLYVVDFNNHRVQRFNIEQY